MDRRIIAALTVAVILETAGALVWAGASAERLSNLEAEMRHARPGAERLARVEAEVQAIRAQLERIENKLERTDTR